MSIGQLETLAGVTDRTAFWMPFAHFEDGFDRGVDKLREMAGLPLIKRKKR